MRYSFYRKIQAHHVKSTMTDDGLENIRLFDRILSSKKNKFKIFIISLKSLGGRNLKLCFNEKEFL